MTRVLVVIAFLIAAAFLIYRQAGHDHRETTLQREKEISDAINDSDSAPSWRDKLLRRE